MTTRYVGIGGNDSNDGLSWANRKLTLNGVEDTPVEAGDVVYIGAGTYRDAMTCDVDGTAGAGVITYIGDVDGSHTDGTGGTIRITGTAADELTYSTATMITIAKAYRTFKNLFIGGSTNQCVAISAGGSNATFEKCLFTESSANYSSIFVNGADIGTIIVKDCIFFRGVAGSTTYSACIYFNHSSENNTGGHVVQNCLLIGGYYGITTTRVGGITVKNCSILLSGMYGIYSTTVNTTYPMAVTNCVIYGSRYGIYAAGAGQITEDYNNIDMIDVALTNVTAGAHSTAYPTNFDMRWAAELLWQSGTLVTPFDLASYSGIINVAGTSPTTADLRGTTVQGAQREWGALEYDSTLDIEVGTGGGGGGAVRILPFGGIGL